LQVARTPILTQLWGIYGLIIGWDLVLEYALGAATVGVSWSRYLLELLNKYGVSTLILYVPWETLTLGDGTVIDGGILTFPQY
jgi:APA family basic amino acid/polyamine antiporter